jgi:hypothetical protein
LVFKRRLDCDNERKNLLSQEGIVMEFNTGREEISNPSSEDD